MSEHNPELEPTTSALTPKQELFCQYYTLKGETFGNGTLAFAKAYNYDLDSFPRDDNVYEFPDGSHMTGKEIYDKEFKENTQVDKHREVEASTYAKKNLTCRTSASRLLTNRNVIDRITALNAKALENDLEYDARLREISLQGKDTDAIAAIKHRNDLRGRIIKRTSADVTITENPLKGLSKDELLKIINTPDEETPEDTI